MVKRVSATKAKNNFGLIVDEVYAKGNKIIVERNKKPAVIIIPYSEKDSGKRPEFLTSSECAEVKKNAKELRKDFKFTSF